jgi:MPBQ/MSBQ methyltransferase
VINVQSKINTQAIGLDVGLHFVKWLTGSENLHYGLWNDLEVTAGNLRQAQEAYTDKLFDLLPKTPSRILDIGGGAGTTAAKLIALGHTVEIVVPSPLLADRCRENAPKATVHECLFEDFAGSGPFDICLFSESYQYIPLERGVPRCLDLLTADGHIIVSDCFRTDAYTIERGTSTVGGGHAISKFRTALASWPVQVLSEEDITQATAPSVEIEQGMFNVLGYGLHRVDADLKTKRPKLRWMLNQVVRALVDNRKRSRLDQRLNQQTRNRDVFATNNVYLMMKLARA